MENIFSARYIFLQTLSVLVGGALLILALSVMPRHWVNWGTWQMSATPSVTVVGYASSDAPNQMARFSAGVMATNADKDMAVDQVNAELEKLTASLRTFGIPENDIKTQNISVYKMERSPFEPGVRVGDNEAVWQANNTLEITLRQIDQANALTDLLTRSGATNVYGPSFSIDDSQDDQNALIEEAMEDARIKAKIMAQASGRVLGAVLNVSESGASGPIYPLMRMEGGGAGGADLAPGTTQVSKTVTVTFALQ